MRKGIFYRIKAHLLFSIYESLLQPFLCPFSFHNKQVSLPPMFAQLMEGILKKLERYCATARPMLGGEVYLTGEEVCSQLQLSTRTLQEYRNAGILPFYKIGGKILYKQSDIQTILERHYNPIPQTGKL